MNSCSLNALRGSWLRHCLSTLTLLVASVDFSFGQSNEDVAQSPPNLESVVDPIVSMSRFDFWDNRDFPWFAQRVPVLETPSAELDEIWWYRWQLVTKHLVYGSPQDGWSCTEFIDRPFWSGTYGAISCPAGLQLEELRWMRDPTFARDYTNYWFRVEGAQPRRYSTWLADAALKVHRVHPDQAWLQSLLPDLIANYEGWERERFDDQIGLFWQIGHDDGMETNINSRQTPDWFRGAPAYRPTLNAYMYADALAIARIAKLQGDAALADQYLKKAQSLRELMLMKLWDDERQFLFPMARQDEELDGFVVKRGSLTHQTGKFAGSPYGRELIGYVPWQFNMVDERFANAWAKLFEDEGFRAPYGPTTVERRDPLFLISPNCCVWSGQSWPYATSQTLKALANVIQGQSQEVVDATDYWQLLETYVKTHRLHGRPFIGEAANPDTGSWDGHNTYNHSEHYFHSSFCDLVITGLLGVQERNDQVLALHPLVPNDWDYFLLQDFPYHGHELTLVWDRTGERYQRGAGLSVWLGGHCLVRQESLAPLEIALPEITSPIDATHQYDAETSSGEWVNVTVNNSSDYFPRVQLESDVRTSGIVPLFDGQGWDYSDPVRAWVVEPGSESVQLVIDLGTERTIDTLLLNVITDHPNAAAPTRVRLERETDDHWESLLDQLSPTDASQWGHRDVPLRLKPNADGDSNEWSVQRVRVIIDRDPERRLILTELGLWGNNPLPYPAAPPAPQNLAQRHDGSEFPRLSASHTSRFDQLEMATDGIVSFRPGPHNRWTSYESKSDSDWLMIQWEKPLEIKLIELGIYDDHGGVQAPEAFTLSVRIDGQWQEVRERKRVPAEPIGGQFNSVEIEPVVAEALKVQFKHRGASRSGITELIVN